MRGKMIFVLAFLMVMSGMASAAQQVRAPAPETKEATNFQEIFTKGKVSGTWRNIWFNRDIELNKPKTVLTPDQASFATGGILRASTASFKGVTANVGFYTVQDLGLNNAGNDDTNYLFYHRDGKTPYSMHDDSESFSVMGEYFLQSQWGKTVTRVGSIDLSGPWKTPYMSSFDVRMMPGNYEGLFIQNRSIENLTIYVAPYIWKFRSNEKKTWSTPASVLTGNAEDRQGMSFIGLTYKPIKELTLDGWYTHHYDVIYTTYWEAAYLPKLTKDLTFILKAMYVAQKEVNKGLIGKYEANQWAVRTGVDAYGATLELSYAETADKNALKNFLGPSSYTGNLAATGPVIMKADMKSYKIEFGFDEFGDLTGVKALDGFDLAVLWTQHDFANAGPKASADLTEISADLAYRFAGNLAGLSTRAAYSILYENIGQGGRGRVESFRFWLERRF